MARRDRCPRCGYVLKLSGVTYFCNFCGLRGKLPLSSILSSLENTLRGRIENFLQTQKSINYQNTRTTLQPCIFCGLSFPAGYRVCPRCGRTPDYLTPLERRVFDYISAHDGTISMSQATRDLSVSPELLSQVIERLKALGILKQS